MTIAEVLQIAESHIGKGAMVSSAKLALGDAKRLAEAGETEPALTRALMSLSYSVGVFHSDYTRILTLVRRAERAGRSGAVSG